MINYGWTVCKLMALDGSIDEILDVAAETARESGHSVEESMNHSAYIVGVASTTLCPSLEQYVRDWENSQN